MTHLLVTNDFPPKVGGIQSYLWELWRRLPPGAASVLTTAHPDSARFDAAQPFPVERVAENQMLPTPALARRITDAARRHRASLVVLDPALPLGLLGPHLGLPYAVVLHGAEVTVPGRLPVTSQLLARVISRSCLVVAAGGYPAAEGRRVAGAKGVPAIAVVPPGVDTERFRPLGRGEVLSARRRLGLPTDGLLVSSISRLVPRKGMDVLIEAAARLAPSVPDLAVVIAGKGRDRERLERLVRRSGAPVTFAGAVPDEDLAGLYGASDVFAMACRNRWAGLEQEGFGIVFLEAAACGVPQVAGDSGGASEAVVDGETGFVVRHPRRVAEVTDALRSLLGDAEARRAMGAKARSRAVSRFSYDSLAADLHEALLTAGG
ncbi:MAG TPA: glycosyltransferase family 4 protein [Acidimicrobiales bacterium]|nr:glycosyltransferase family 4 protein [Acidimicrobiales bacterium]